MEKPDTWQTDGKSIFKTFEFPDPAIALKFVAKAGEIANELDHHPDLTWSYKTVKIVLTTHDKGGVTEKDHELAAKFDELEKS